jgi:hypothetical protein
MTNTIVFSIIILSLISSLIAQYTYVHNLSWNRSNRQNFMAPIHLYDGVPLSKNIHPTAPPIDTVQPINHNRYRNDLFTTRTTYFFPPLSTTTIQTNKRYHFRRRNRTRLQSTTQQTAQHFGIVVNIYEPIEGTTTNIAITTTIPTTTTTRRSRWELTTTTTQSFFQRFPKLPSQMNRPPPPTVPRSFTTLTSFTYPSRIITTTTTTTTPTSSQSSKNSIYFLNSFLIKVLASTSLPPRPSTPSHSSWLITVPSFSQILNQYPRYPTIIRWFEELSQHPNISRFFAYEIVGRTHENRSLIVAKIGLMPFQTNRRSVWLDGGIHAREWISTATVLYTMARLINGTLARDNDVRKLIDTYDFYFMPVVNPDGYVYTHDDIKQTWDTEEQQEQQEQQRMWRKNRRPHNDCPGVDLNRNFPFAWDNRGASKFPW